ncbi:probable membrane-associated kinase regulator 2 [Argentina anserina]|uniref:probable membrane-associated kinase regulator 2 n=1 Tax=Argentina anserina TaxID=57926 RepID=UPI00217643FA|nr:probable membrane-associated kinase regulator 2 [Potentilla anserina]
MEAFSLLKYWRGGGLVASSTTPLNAPNVTSAAATILTAVAENCDDSHDTDDDGPFFDLEFSVPDEEDEAAHEASDSTTSGDDDSDDVEVQQHGEDDESDDDDDVDGEEEGEFNFTVSSGSSNDRTDPNLSMSPSDDLFFKGKLVPIEPSSFVFNSAEPNSKAQFPGSLLKSATKLRVFMSGLKKSKSNLSNPESKTEPTNGSQQEQNDKVLEDNKQQKQGKLFTVKLKVEEVPIVSLFTRDNSSRISTKTQSQKAQISEEAASEEKRFSKEVVQKYLKMVKPLVVRVSKRYGEKTRFSGQLTSATPEEKSGAEAEVSEAAAAASNVRSLKQGNIPAGLRVVCKHLGKSRSASSAVAAAPPGTVPSQRRDDSLLQQQDGIQSAILHCKRSFNASRDSDCTPLPRSVSDSCKEKASGQPSDQNREV